MEEVRRKKLIELLGEEWENLLENEFEQSYMKNLSVRIAEEREKGKKIYPRTEDIFNCFKLTPYNKVKVILVAQDPYINEISGIPVAHGLSFSSQIPSYCPPSLKNIFDEIEQDIKFGLYLKEDFNLTYWTEQGVFLLNKVLTVEAGKSNSHKGWGWEVFTVRVIKLLNQNPNKLVFILLGREAQEYSKLIDQQQHLVLEYPHPQSENYAKQQNKPSTGFFGSKIFSKTNKWLVDNGYKEINW